jgi:DNA-binding response OmpR family regulator
MGKKILIVDDEKLLNDLYATKFKKEGFTVVSAFNGEEALAVAHREDPDLILLDVLMPKLNGIEALQQMRQDEALKDTPVVILSVLGEPDDISQGLEAGANGYIVKGQSSPAETVDKVKEILM